MKLFKFLALSLLILATSNKSFAASSEAKSEFLLLHQVLIAHEMIANSKPSNKIDRKIAGSIVMINDKKYQVISFMFVDINNNNENMTFGNYAKANNLLIMRSQDIRVFKNIEFKVFDSNEAMVGDDIYFHLKLQQIK